MNRLRILGLAAGVGLIAVALFAACGSDGDEITVVSSLESTGITVSGHGEVDAPPDIAYVDLGVRVRAGTVAEARERAAAAATSLIESLESNGLEDGDIQTRGLAIYPVYEYPNGTERLVGYEVTNTVAATVRDIAAVGQVIDDAIAAAGEDAILQGIRFDREDIEEFAAQAREEAVADAKRRAEQLASLNGLTVGEPLAISEGAAGGQPEPLFYDDAFRSTAELAGTPVQPGTGKVVVNLQVRFAIAK